MRHKGRELLLDLFDCKSASLNDTSLLERILLDAAQFARFDVVGRMAHQFPHQGITLVLILGQSHATLHTWPESRFAALDVYVCDESRETCAALETIRDHLIQILEPRSFESRLIERGLDTRAEQS